jgi:hypothetical protein
MLILRLESRRLLSHRAYLRQRGKQPRAEAGVETRAPRRLPARPGARASRRARARAASRRARCRDRRLRRRARSPWAKSGSEAAAEQPAPKHSRRQRGRHREGGRDGGERRREREERGVAGDADGIFAIGATMRIRTLPPRTFAIGSTMPIQTSSPHGSLFAPRRNICERYNNAIQPLPPRMLPLHNSSPEISHRRIISLHVPYLRASNMMCAKKHVDSIR